MCSGGYSILSSYFFTFFFFWRLPLYISVFFLIILFHSLCWISAMVRRAPVNRQTSPATYQQRNGEPWDMSTIKLPPNWKSFPSFPPSKYRPSNTQRDDYRLPSPAPSLSKDSLYIISRWLRVVRMCVSFGFWLLDKRGTFFLLTWRVKCGTLWLAISCYIISTMKMNNTIYSTIYWAEKKLNKTNRGLLYIYTTY